jgi:hypothetical protein
MEDPQKQEDTYGTGQGDGDLAFGAAAAEDQDRVDAGEEPIHTEDPPRAWGKAEPA